MIGPVGVVLAALILYIVSNTW